MAGEGEEPVPVEEEAEAPVADEAAEEAAEGEAPPEGGDDVPIEASAEMPAEASGELPAEEGAADDEPAAEAPAGDEVYEGDASADVPAGDDMPPELGDELAMPSVDDPVDEPEETRSEVGRRTDSGRGSPLEPDSPEGDFPEGGIDSAMLDGDLSPGGTEGVDGDDMGEFGEDGYEEEQVDPLQELQEKYDQLLELNERAMQTNVALQRRVIQRKAQEKPWDAAEKQSDGKVTEHKYQNVLLNVHSVRLKLRLQQVKAARMSDELKNQLEAKRQKAIECRDSFQEFKRQVARHAEYARTGKKIPEKIIQEVEEFELDKDAEVEEVRGSNISLKNRLAKLEQALRKKDELAENLHVIDFEQLKIENQTLNEKIEERNEELHKLRKKTIVTVQIITHMREKVQFVAQEYAELRNKLAQLELDLASQRDTVTKTKHERDDIRTENAKYRQQTGITNSEGLSKDYDARAEHIKSLIQDIANLKNRHKQMITFVQRHGGKV
jgi:hypothetical protein